MQVPTQNRIEAAHRAMELSRLGSAQTVFLAGPNRYIVCSYVPLDEELRDSFYAKVDPSDGWSGPGAERMLQALRAHIPEA